MSRSPAALKHLWLFGLAIVAGGSYWLIGEHHLPQPVSVAWKGSGVGLLGLWAALNAQRSLAWWFVLVLALDALGDVLIDVVSLRRGALAFVIGHVIASLFYLAHRRRLVAASQVALAAMLFFGVPLICFLMAPHDHKMVVTSYGASVGAMAAMAWVSRFPRYRVGIGTVLFVASDLIIVAGLDLPGHPFVTQTLIWPLYFSGQALIAWGVVSSLVRWRENDSLHHRL